MVSIFVIMCSLLWHCSAAALNDKTKCKCRISLWSLWLRLAIEMMDSHTVAFSYFNGIVSAESYALAGRALFFVGRVTYFKGAV